MESQILIRGFRSIKSSSFIYRTLSCCSPCLPHSAREHSTLVSGVSLKSGMNDPLSYPSGQPSENLQPGYNGLRLAQAQRPSPRDVLAHLLALAESFREQELKG